MDYEEMLKKGIENLPKKTDSKERFEIPKVMGHLQGNKTVISNFVQIANAFGRPVEHMLKYILKELATPGELQNNNILMLGTKVSSERINKKIQQYAEEYVICKECGKPDTKIEKEGEFTFMKCMVCGAKKPVKIRI
jgi:translation initiation factor 2 subunit 2